MFSRETVKDMTEELRESMFQDVTIGTIAMYLNKKQKERLERKSREEKERKKAEETAKQDKEEIDKEEEEEVAAQSKGG